MMMCQSLLDTTRSLRSLPSSTQWLIPGSRYQRRLRVMGVSGFNPHIPLISPMLRIFEKSSVWKDERSFNPLRSMDKTWLISLEIAKWSRCIHRLLDPPIRRLPTGISKCSPQWSLTISQPTTIYCRSVENICIPMITRLDRLMFLFHDMDGNIMRLNSELELQF